MVPADLVTNLGSAHHWNFSFPKPVVTTEYVPELAVHCVKLEGVNGHQFWA